MAEVALGPNGGKVHHLVLEATLASEATPASADNAVMSPTSEAVAASSTVADAARSEAAEAT